MVNGRASAAQAGLLQPSEVCKMFHCLGSLGVSRIDLEGLKEWRREGYKASFGVTCKLLKMARE